MSMNFWKMIDSMKKIDAITEIRGFNRFYTDIRGLLVEQQILESGYSLTEARTLYKKAGFNITETSENNNWGVPVLEEKWELEL